jgi:hypothetical protein
MCIGHKACVSFFLQRLFETLFAPINILMVSLEICAEAILICPRVSVRYACSILTKLKYIDKTYHNFPLSDLIKMLSEVRELFHAYAQTGRKVTDAPQGCGRPLRGKKEVVI